MPFFAVLYSVVVDIHSQVLADARLFSSHFIITYLFIIENTLIYIGTCLTEFCACSVQMYSGLLAISDIKLRFFSFHYCLIPSPPVSQVTEVTTVYVHMLIYVTILRWPRSAILPFSISRFCFTFRAYNLMLRFRRGSARLAPVLCTNSILCPQTNKVSHALKDDD